jgi:hypothetical protein
MFCVRLLSSTTLSGHNRLINSSFSRTSPAPSRRRRRVSTAFALSGTSSPARRRRRFTLSMRYGPNA